MQKNKVLALPSIGILFILLSAAGTAQPIFRKALFLGNSYTYVNDLPLLTAAIAHSAGDSLYHDSNTPGGYTLGWQPIAHSTDPVSLAKIGSNSWDFMILQEQSQTPAIYRLRDSCMFPGSVILHDSIKSANPCARVLFYLTWARRFGGVQCFTPNYCSFPFTGFDQMQDTLTHAYKKVADSLSDWIAPVGEAWRFVLGNTGIVLHSSDDSHPNLNGSYLAACVFYSVIFGKPSAGLSFTAGLAPDTALILQQAADSIIFGFSSFWNLGNDLPHASFSTDLSGDTLFTHNFSTGAGNWRWDFGDGQTSTMFEPYHVYQGPGTRTVRLLACNVCFCDSAAQNVTILPMGMNGVHAGKEPIRLVGTGRDGSLKILNFEEEGTLTFYDITGRITAIVNVGKGLVETGFMTHGLWLWTLSNRKNEAVARGRIIFISRTLPRR